MLDATSCSTRPGLLREARRDGAADAAGDDEGRRTAAAADGSLDHRRILATALGRLRGKLKYRPVVFELLPPTFTLLQLQRVVEALAGIRLHKQNFRRLVEPRAGRRHRPGGHPRPAGARPSCSRSGARCCASGRPRASGCRACDGLARRPTGISHRRGH